MRIERLIKSSLSLIALAAILVGCSHTRPKPQLIHHRDGSMTTYKRYERLPQRDFFNRIVRKAYDVPDAGDFDFSGQSQDILLEQWGRPDYVRKPFTSLQGEKVEEWVYLDQNRIFQFVDHELIFEGELTDLEQILMRKGYPDQGIDDRVPAGARSSTHSITETFSFRENIETFNLANGWLVHGVEGY